MPRAVPSADRAPAAAPGAGSGVRSPDRQPQQPFQVRPSPGGRPRPPVNACIFSAIAASALRRASLCAVTSKSSRISRSSAFISEASILTAFTSIFALIRTATRPPPAMPSTSTLPSSSCIACIFDCSCAACCIMPRKSGIRTFLEWLEIVVVGIFSAVFADNIGFRRLGGKLAYFDHLGAGEKCHHLLHARIGFGGPLALVFRNLPLRAQGRLSRLVGDDHGPALSRPLLELAGEIVNQGFRGVTLQRELQPSILDSDQTDRKSTRLNSSHAN